MVRHGFLGRVNVNGALSNGDRMRVRKRAVGKGHGVCVSQAGDATSEALWKAWRTN